MGKISRFGLMELSRQRLRPSLGEGSNITCPRCNGTGHIRGTESTALHILRIIQEEAMKENSASVHAQVPVDVATFLLNEKRADIHSIEARLKVNVVLIPNTNLETPNYKVDRLRHDDLNQADTLPASYNMVSAPAEEEAPAQAAQETRPTRLQPAVQGVTPERPAPVAAQASGRFGLKRKRPGRERGRRPSLSRGFSVASSAGSRAMPTPQAQPQPAPAPSLRDATDDPTVRNAVTAAIAAGAVIATAVDAENAATATASASAAKAATTIVPAATKIAMAGAKAAATGPSAGSRRPSATRPAARRAASAAIGAPGAAAQRSAAPARSPRSAAGTGTGTLETTTSAGADVAAAATAGDRGGERRDGSAAGFPNRNEQQRQRQPRPDAQPSVGPTAAELVASEAAAQGLHEPSHTPVEAREPEFARPPVTPAHEAPAPEVQTRART